MIDQDLSRRVFPLETSTAYADPVNCAQHLFDAVCTTHWKYESLDSEFTSNPHQSPCDLLPDLPKHPNAFEAPIPAFRDPPHWPVAMMALEGMNLPVRDDLIEALEHVSLFLHLV